MSGGEWLRPAYRKHVWAYDFVHERTHDVQTLRLLTVVDVESFNGKLRDELLNRKLFYPSPSGAGESALAACEYNSALLSAGAA
jgi:hypothetical protein